MYIKPQTVNLGFDRESFNAAVQRAGKDALESGKMKQTFSFISRKLDNGQIFTREDVWELTILGINAKTLRPTWEAKRVSLGEWKMAE